MTRHMHVHFLNTNDIHSRTTKWVKSGDYDSNKVNIPNKAISNQDMTAEMWKEVNTMK